MAGVLRRRRGLIFKMIIGVPILWFSFIGFTVVMTGGGPPEYNNNIPRFVADSNVLNPTKDVVGRIGTGAPVIEPPNPDRLRLWEKMRKDAEEELERKQFPHERRIQGENGGEDPENGGLLGQVGKFVGHVGQVVAQPFNPRRDNAGGKFHEHLKSSTTTTVDPNAPGEQGKAIIIDKKNLPSEERRKFDEGWQKNAFNQYASDKMSLHRSLPDVRDSDCRRVKYPSQLPDTSVIVCFHNEAWSVLLRTVHSILDRSPAHLIKEIILVDDFSDMDHVKKPLEDYIAKLGKVKVVRAKQREGLIRARLLGASVATGAVLTYLDSHCECATGWLEPLLARIAANKSNVVTPVIDVIDDETLRYQYSSAKSTSIGGFDWNLQFNWHAIPDHEKRRRKTDIDPVRSPTMAGGLFSISREYFEYLGAYDPGMDIWGGENLELSFRVWMCGGILEIIPCSHVGHIFRKRSPYSWKTGVNVVKKNSVRLAEVWMDDYKQYYYERFNNDLGNYGDVSGRKALRERLQCKSFDWFIRNIYPDLFIPGDSVASGEIRNKVRAQCLDSAADKHAYNKPIKMWPCHNMGGNQIRSHSQAMCLDSSVDTNAMNKPVKMWPCHEQGGNQYWMFSQHGEIRRDEGCMDYAGQFVMIYPCHGMKGNQEWVYGPDNTLRHRNTNLCIELSEDGQKVDMKPCTGIDRQIWIWKRKTPDSELRQQNTKLVL